MLLASTVDVAVGWVWHTAYRARWHWKLKREGALIAAGFVALIGAVDTARSLHGGAQIAPAETATLTAPPPAPVVASVAPAGDTSVAGQQSASAPLQTAATSDTAPQFPIIQDQTGSIDQADPIETILPMDPAAERDDPIARKINERFGDAADEPVKRQKPRPVKTAAAKPVKTKPAKKPADNSMD